MVELQQIRQCLNDCLSGIQDALDTLNLIEERGGLSEEIIEAVSIRIFNVIDELDDCDNFIQKLCDCKTEAEMEAFINAGVE